MDAPIRRYVRLQEHGDRTPKTPTTRTDSRKREKPFAGEWALLKELGLAGDQEQRADFRSREVLRTYCRLEFRISSAMMADARYRGVTTAVMASPRPRRYGPRSQAFSPLVAGKRRQQPLETRS
jgi:hypothetical protein